MQVEKGSIVEGKVTGVTKFGAFVEIEGGQKGLVHISEVSNTYVEDISTHLTNGQIVKVKILDITDNGKLNLSIKKASPPPMEVKKRQYTPSIEYNPYKDDEDDDYSSGSKKGKNSKAKKGSSSHGSASKSSKSTKGKGNEFENMISQFISTSGEKIGDMRKVTNNRRGTSKKFPKDY